MFFSYPQYNKTSSVPPPRSSCTATANRVQRSRVTILFEENTMGKGNNSHRKEVKKKKAKKDKPKPTSR